MVSPILFLAPDVFVKNIALSLKKFNYNNDSNSVASCRVCQKTGNIIQVLLQLPRPPPAPARLGEDRDTCGHADDLGSHSQVQATGQLAWPVHLPSTSWRWGGLGRAWSLADKGPFLQIPVEHPAAFCKGILGAWGL